MESKDYIQIYEQQQAERRLNELAKIRNRLEDLLYIEIAISDLVTSVMTIEYIPIITNLN